jgi:4-diphosphocytidyl-2-C-methyl-D-erythritol kinase
MQAAGLLMNDLEVACLHILPSLKGRRDALIHQGALGAIVSGSGPTVFGVFASAEEADGACAKLRAVGHEAHRAATLAGSFASA